MTWDSSFTIIANVTVVLRGVRSILFDMRAIIEKIPASHNKGGNMADMSWRDEVKTCVVCGVSFGPKSKGGLWPEKARWRKRICCSKKCNALRPHKPRHKHYVLRFASLVDKKDLNSCWLWKGNRDEKGYGRFSFQDKDMRAHRMAYTLAYGPIPEGLLIRHTCDNPPCVNPNHLLVGTDADNVRDMMERGRHASAAKYPSALIEQILIEYVALPKGPKGKCSPGVSAAFLKKYNLPSQTLSNWLRDFSISF